jgi:hypothetical protein
MFSTKTALFITHPNSLESHVTGGVQLCSQEFLSILKESGFIINPYFVNYTTRLFDRILIKLKIDNYRHFNVNRYLKGIINQIEENKVSLIFINMATLVRFAKPIKKRFGEKVKIVLLSHGNLSGDFLHLTTKPIKKQNVITKFRNIVRLGYLIHTESFYRNYFLDAVLTVSEAETQIENWFGAKKTIFIPRLLEKKDIPLHTIYNRVGFVGRLDHPPNYQGITLLLKEISKLNPAPDFRLVGAPVNWGRKIASQFPFVTYLGELSDHELEKEASSWSLFLNPVFWYSTGVTTKLAWALSRGIPVVTTTPGMRGYKWKRGDLPITETPIKMAEYINLYIENPSLSEDLKIEVGLIINNSYTATDISQSIIKQLDIF